MPISKPFDDVRVNAILTGTQGRPAVEVLGGAFVVAWGHQACGEAQIVHDRLIGNQGTSGVFADIWNPAYEAVVDKRGMIAVTWQDRGAVHDARLGADPGDIMFTVLNPLVATVGDDGLWRGGDWADRIVGTGTDDRLFGNGGADMIRGQKGRDLIVGGAGADTMAGGKGRDTFAFAAASDGPAAAGPRDTITDFLAGTDRLEFRFDFNTAAAGLQRFDFIGTAAFAGAGGAGRGQLRFEQAGDLTLVLADTDRDGTADVVIALQGLHDLTARDVVWDIT
jgi:Ca2+-binding RTX toxin-like protein